MFQKLCQTIGKNVINGSAATGRMSILFMETIKRLKDADMKEVFRQTFKSFHKKNAHTSGSSTTIYNFFTYCLA